ncbi:MAG: hypothetical protein COY80_03865 [Candidatus Pacebacteria bacterium CG_4_10_14_0_8_um_filter_42_14]|nr:MAG: hypothetical protein COY80_03865 [Candidatus Pacebacteria bacterium CG_4_10_14_0_8_um_filter_42_14]
MKVIFVTREGSQLSGARVRCHGFARQLNTYGIETEIFSFADNLGAKCAEEESQMSWITKLKYNLAAFKRLIKTGEKDIFFLQRLNYHALAPFLISWPGKRKFIFDCDDWNIRENPVYRFGFYPSSKMEYLTRKLAGYSNVCIAASGFLNEYLSQFNKLVYYLPTGVDTQIFSPKAKDKNTSEIIFSWIGTAYHPEMGENLRFILDVFLALADRNNNIFLSLAGKGKYFNEVISGLDIFKYKDRVINEGWISPEQIPAYLSKIDIGLLPLIQNTKFNLAKSPTKLFEYMAMAKPTVSSNIGEAARIIQDNKNGFLANNKEEFIVKMNRLIADSVLRQQLGIQARKTVEENYSLSVLGKQLYEIIRTV